MAETIKVAVRRTSTEEVEVTLPIYCGFEDDVADGRAYYEARIYINEKLESRSITRWTGDTEKLEFEFHQLKPNDLGQYLRYDKIEPSEFAAWSEEAKQLLS